MRAIQENPKYICECGELIDYMPGQDCPECGAEIVVVHPDGTTEAPKKPKMISDAKYRELLNTWRKDQVRRLAAIGDESPHLRSARVSFQESIAQIDAILEMM
jgi:hypothetical protein